MWKRCRQEQDAYSGNKGMEAVGTRLPHTTATHVHLPPPPSPQLERFDPRTHAVLTECWGSAKAAPPASGMASGMAGAAPPAPSVPRLRVAAAAAAPAPPKAGPSTDTAATAASGTTARAAASEVAAVARGLAAAARLPFGPAKRRAKEALIRSALTAAE